MQPNEHTPLRCSTAPEWHHLVPGLLVTCSECGLPLCAPALPIGNRTRSPPTAYSTLAPLLPGVRGRGCCRPRNATERRSPPQIPLDLLSTIGQYQPWTMLHA